MQASHLKTGNNIEKNKSTWAVIVYVGNYMRKEKGSSCDLIGVYPTKEAAMFISRKAKFNMKLAFYPKVIPSSAPVTTTKVEPYLAYINEKEEKRNGNSKSITDDKRYSKRG